MHLSPDRVGAIWSRKIWSRKKWRLSKKHLVPHPIVATCTVRTFEGSKSYFTKTAFLHIYVKCVLLPGIPKFSRCLWWDNVKCILSCIRALIGEFHKQWHRQPDALQIMLAISCGNYNLKHLQDIRRYALELWVWPFLNFSFQNLEGGIHGPGASSCALLVQMFVVHLFIHPVTCTFSHGLVA